MKTLRRHNTNNRFIGLLLCLLCMLPIRAASETDGQEKQKAMSAFDVLDRSNNYHEQLTVADLNNLPMGIKRTLGNVEYTVAVSGYVHTGDHAELRIYGRIKIPRDENRVLFFGASGVKFSYDGDFRGNCKPMLLNDISLPIMKIQGLCKFFLHKVYLI
jgi:hypothetical protein